MCIRDRESPARGLQPCLGPTVREAAGRVRWAVRPVAAEAEYRRAPESGQTLRCSERQLLVPAAQARTIYVHHGLTTSHKGQFPATAAPVPGHACEQGASFSRLARQAVRQDHGLVARLRAGGLRGPAEFSLSLIHI